MPLPQGSLKGVTLIVLSEEDPVARGVSSCLGQGEATAWVVNGTPIRRLSPTLLTLRRRPIHIHDEGLNAALSGGLLPTLGAVIFPSLHRSESGKRSFTVHPLGNLTAEAPVGGQPRRLNPVPAYLMNEAFLRLREEGEPLGIETTFEATHHGPFLDTPSFFIEIGSSAAEWERPEHHRAIARVLADLDGTRVAGDPIVVGVGGGHYVPRFKDLVRKRRVAVAHLIPSHHLGVVDETLAREVVHASLGAVGCFYTKSAERDRSPFANLLPDSRHFVARIG